MFPGLQAKLVSPVRTFSLPPVTRVGPDGAAATAKKAAAAAATPQPKRKAFAAPPRLLPKKLLKQVPAF